MPEISVIVPVYKVEPYLSRCVDSILNQTFRDFELILVDDGSPDNCPDICDGYAKNDERITVIHQENRGVSAARNAGIKKVLSENISQWIVFIDSDDMVTEDYLERLIGCVSVTKTKLAVCSFSLVSEDNNPLPLNVANPIPFGCLTAEEALDRLQKLNGWIWSVPWNKIYHRSLLSENFFPVGINHEDEFIIAPLLWNAKKIGCIGEKLYVYTYMRKDGITGSKLFKNKLDKMDVLFERCKFYESIGMKDLILYNKIEYLNLLRECKKEISINTQNRKEIEKFTIARKRFLRMPGLTIKDKIKWLLL